MASILPPQTDISRNEQGIVRRISHARVPFQPSGFIAASPTTLASWYLEQVGDLFGLSKSWLPASTELERVNDINRLVLANVSSVQHTTVVSYNQTYADLPVFEAGLAVRVSSDLSAVISAQSTLHLDIDIASDLCRSFRDDSTEFSDAQICEMLGYSSGERQSRIERSRVVIYRYLPEARFDPATRDEDQPPSSPRISLPDVPDSIIPGRHRVVHEVFFALSLPDWGLLEWIALIDIKTRTVLYIRAFVESCTGAVFRDDPITISGDITNTPCASAAVLNPLTEVVSLEGLSAPMNPGDPQALSGEYVELVDTDTPSVAPPTATLPACDFNFSAISDEFAAVNAYFHMDALYRMTRDMGFVNYFPGTSFPIPMDHRGENGAVNAHHHGSGNGTTKYRFGLAQSGCDVGMACDRRVVIHEFGHSVLRNHINSGVFSFAHGVGDTMAVILSDPDSQAPDRFETFPFNTINRRHDRAVSDGWGWGGVRDTGSYASTQILATTMFRAYRSLGGDASELEERQFAARYMTYLILAAVGLETPFTQPASPEDFAADVIEADLTTATFEGHPGGAFHKVIRWAFAQQNAYKGLPPDIDVYIDDSRSGEYPWLDDFTNTTDIWTRYDADGGTVHQPPLVGTPAYVYVTVRNRGTNTATDVTVKAFVGPPGGEAVWPDQFIPLSPPALPALGPIPPGESVVVGPFEWIVPDTPKETSIIMSTSTPEDTSNIDVISGSLQTRRLVPYDNNLAQRDIVVSRYPVQYSVKFVCGPSCGGPVAPGSYYTAINIHNPTDETIRFRKKVAIALPGEKPGHVSKFTFNRLGAHEALEIDCADIYCRAGLPQGCFLKGFVVIQSLVELDVVAVYSAAGADKQVETLDIQYITPQVESPMEPPPEPPSRLPDLIPVPGFSPPSSNAGQLPQNFCFSSTGGNIADMLRIIVRNQGVGPALASITEVRFENNPPLSINTPAILAGDEAILEVRIPNGCFVGESSCGFDITVNATSLFDESNNANNTVSSACPGVVS